VDLAPPPPPEQAPQQRHTIHASKDFMAGIVLRNSSVNPVPPMSQVLQIYKSAKDTEAVGENGIGAKHACASLSKLSVFFSKSENKHFGVGILMEELQREGGIILPSDRWELSSDEDYENKKDFFEAKFKQLVATKPHTWGAALTAFGKSPTIMDSKTLDDEMALDRGIERCVTHLLEMATGPQWKDYTNVFTVVLTDLRHQQHKSKHKEENNADIICDNEGADDEEEQGRAGSLLDELHAKLPYIYLHLHQVDVMVMSQQIPSCYWERKLIELSKFEIAIPETKSWLDEGSEWYRSSFGGNSFNTKTIRFFIGFDPYRCGWRSCKNGPVLGDGGDEQEPIDATLPTNEVSALLKEDKTCALRVYTYSRASGRLIKMQNDPRRDYGLSAGSTDFTHGLTMIIDDYQGTLPLNPTKQDFAFGHAEYGAMHESNVHHWTSALIHFFCKRDQHCLC
jgi:hypothetical protein